MPNRIEIIRQSIERHGSVGGFEAELLAEVDRLSAIIKAAGLHRAAPCCLCGYNGPGYHQPATHPCMEVSAGRLPVSPRGDVNADVVDIGGAEKFTLRWGTSEADKPM